MQKLEINGKESFRRHFNKIQYAVGAYFVLLMTARWFEKKIEISCLLFITRQNSSRSRPGAKIKREKLINSNKDLIQCGKEKMRYNGMQNNRAREKQASHHKSTIIAEHKKWRRHRQRCIYSKNKSQCIAFVIHDVLHISPVYFNNICIYNLYCTAGTLQNSSWASNRKKCIISYTD